MMRSLLAAALSLFASTTTLASAEPRPELLEYNVDTAYTRFTVPCPAFTACSEADESLEFELELDHEPVPLSYLSFTLNGQHVRLINDSATRDAAYTGVLAARDSRGTVHQVAYTIEVATTFRTLDQAESRGFVFETISIDGVLTSDLQINVHNEANTPGRLEHLIVSAALDGPGVDFDLSETDQKFVVAVPIVEPIVEEMARPAKQVSFDLSHELDALHLLEEEAEHLKEQIVVKKLAIAEHLKAHRDHASLRQLLEECDGLACAARILAQRLCNKIGKLASSSEYARVRHTNLQNAVAFSEASMLPQQASRNCTKTEAAGAAQALSVPLLLTKNATTSDSHLIDVIKPQNPFSRALALVATVLGIAALCSYIRHRCMSMRTRVERAADREERRNARAYRKAARRAEMRRRWDHFASAVSCFGTRHEPRIEDYEEKRALILQDAFLEQADDLDQAEKGQIMEAEIRELRHAHEIVASLVRVDEHRYGLATPVPVADPPPPLVPLPATPMARSRASTYTLPSYTSESLPDYSSMPETLLDSSTSDSLVDGFAGYSPTAADSEGRNTPPSTTSSARTKYTPTSSVLDVSTRASEETLRTRLSKDTR